MLVEIAVASRSEAPIVISADLDGETCRGLRLSQLKLAWRAGPKGLVRDHREKRMECSIERVSGMPEGIETCRLEDQDHRTHDLEFRWRDRRQPPRERKDIGRVDVDSLERGQILDDLRSAMGRVIFRQLDGSVMIDDRLHIPDREPFWRIWPPPRIGGNSSVRICGDHEMDGQQACSYRWSRWRWKPGESVVHDFPLKDFDRALLSAHRLTGDDSEIVADRVSISPDYSVASSAPTDKGASQIIEIRDFRPEDCKQKAPPDLP